MIRNNTSKILLLLAVFLLVGTATAYAYSEASIARENYGYNISPALNDTPFVELQEYEPYYGGTDNQKFLTITNNYDKEISTTVYLDNHNWQFSSNGASTITVTVKPSDSKTLYVDIGGANKSCGGGNNNTYSYTYQVNSNSLSITNTTNNVTVCGGSGGPGGPPGGGPPGQ